MQFTAQKFIRVTPYRAPCNDVASGKSHRIAHVTCQLTNEGLAVPGFRFSGSGAPEIELMPCTKLRQWVDSGRAAHDREGKIMNKVIRLKHQNNHDPK